VYKTGREKGLAASTAGLWGGPIGGSNGGCIDFETLPGKALAMQV